MAELTNEQKKAWAKTLYTRETLTQAEIAERVGVSRVTVNNWIGKGNWEQLKASITITREEQLKNLYRQLAELNNAIMGNRKGNGSRTPRKRTPFPSCRTPSRNWKQKWGWRTSSLYSPTCSNGCGPTIPRRRRRSPRFWTRLSNQNYPDMAKKDSQHRTGSRWTTGTSWWHPCENIRTSTPRTRKRKSDRGGKGWRRTMRSGSNTTSPCIAHASPPPSTRKPPGG